MSDHELPSLDWWKQQLCRCYSPRAQWGQSNHFNVDTITIKWHATFDPNAFASLHNNSNKILFIVHHTANHIHSRVNSGYWLSQRKEPLLRNAPDSKVHGANMGPIWGRQDPGGPHELCYLRPSLIDWVYIQNSNASSHGLSPYPECIVLHIFTTIGNNP